MENNLKITPQNLDSERAVLGSCLLDKEAIVKCLSIISPESFYVPSHQVIFQSMKDLYFKNTPIDIVTVSDILQSKGILEEIGNYQYLMGLAESVPTTANVEQYALMVLDSAQRRDLIKVNNESIKKAYDKSIPIETVLDESEKSVLEIGLKRNNKTISHVKDVVLKRFNRFREANDSNSEDEEIVRTGFSDLDKVFDIYKTDFVIIGARPAQGKSAFVINLALKFCEVNKKKYHIENKKNDSLEDETNKKNNNIKPILIFSLEMSKEQITDRMIYNKSGFSKFKLRNSNYFTDEQWIQLSDAVAEINDLPIFIDDFTGANLNQMFSTARKLKSEYKELGAIIIDYLQLAESDNNEMNRVQEISKISRACKKMAMELKAPVIGLSQLSRKVEERSNKRPQLSDLRESGSLEQDANSVLFLYRDEYYNKDTTKSRIAEIIIAKQREGATGTVEMYFDAELSKFTSLEKP